MTEVEITEEALMVHVLAWDQLRAFKSRIEVPLSHVASVEMDPGLAQREWWKGIKAPGTGLPGVIKAGTFYQWRERVFWDVHDPDKTIVIRLRDERYARLVIEVDDPHTTHGRGHKAGARWVTEVNGIKGYGLFAVRIPHLEILSHTDGYKAGGTFAS